MYGKTADDFEYRGVLFRWVRSPNRFIYRIYVESELIGTIPVSQVRARMLPSAIEALYPICSEWLGSHEGSPNGEPSSQRVMEEELVVASVPKEARKKKRGTKGTKKKGVAKGNGRKRKADVAEE